MKKRIKKLWVDALRSGEFQQCERTLRKGGGKNVEYCCLGVLEQIRVQETGDRFTRGKGSYAGLLSEKTQAWAGLSTSDPVLMPLRKKTASDLNDDGKTFAEIADRIEKYL